MEEILLPLPYESDCYDYENFVVILGLNRPIKYPLVPPLRFSST